MARAAPAGGTRRGGRRSTVAGSRAGAGRPARGRPGDAGGTSAARAGRGARAAVVDTRAWSG
ncbi:hypothetical protein FTX61_07145 [Nitriliruptoraceae bacterium ZYF776]|nr:hypothetical protein [Profundirhabdus halotolerans]